jgi:hypothetical protein
MDTQRESDMVVRSCLPHSQTHGAAALLHVSCRNPIRSARASWKKWILEVINIFLTFIFIVVLILVANRTRYHRLFHFPIGTDHHRLETFYCQSFAFDSFPRRVLEISM